MTKTKSNRSLSVFLTAVLAFGLVAKWNIQSSFAAGSRAAKSPQIVRDVVVSSQSSGERSSRGAGGGFGLGFASLASLGNTTGAAIPGLSLAFDLGSMGMLQTAVAISGVTPFTFGVGALYKHIVAGSRAGGFHMGGGLALGTVSGGVGVAQFFLNFNALGGIQFVLPNVNNIQFDFDFGVQTGVNLASSAAVLNVGAFSSLFGMSVHYFF